MRRLTALIVVVAACGDPGLGDGDPIDAGPDAFIGPSQALFEVPRGAPPPSGFYALPFPNDVRIGDHGVIDLADYPRPNQIIGEYVDAIMVNQRGFSINGAIFARFTAPVDVSSLPEPGPSLDPGASVYLVDVDPDSPDRGQHTPLRFRFEHYAGETIGTDWLAALPYPGFPLREETTYALVITDRVRATDGTPVTAAGDFAAIAGTEPPADPDLARAQAIYQPLWDWLDEPGGDERADVISAAVFTTQDATALLRDVREVVFGLEPPRPRAVEWVRATDEYDWYNGLYDAPNFQRGEPPYRLASDGGDIQRDAETGEPIIQRWEEMRFSFTVPRGEMPENGWPVVLYAHGTGGSWHTYRSNGTARFLAEQGIACIGIDQVLHGPRVPPGTSPEIAFFNFQNPLAARDNTLQGAIDNFQLLRLALAFDYTERHPGGRTIRFDPERIYFFGHSQGGLTGPPFLAHEPLIKGAVLSGAGGLLYLSMILKTEPLDVAGIVAAFIRDYPLDEFNPVLALLQGYMDRSDPVSYGPLLSRRPLDGVPAKPIFQSEGFTDRYTPVPSIEALAVSIGGNQVSPVIDEIEGFALRGRPALDAPVSGNLDGITAVLLQYNEASGSDGHFVVFDIPAARTQSIQFLSTLAQTGAATVVAP